MNPNQMPAEYYLGGIGDLAIFLGGSEDSFTGDLLRLIAKADPGNKARLREAFPAEVRTYLVWMLLSEPTVANLTTALTT